MADLARAVATPVATTPAAMPTMVIAKPKTAATDPFAILMAAAAPTAQPASLAMPMTATSDRPQLAKIAEKSGDESEPKGEGDSDKASDPNDPDALLALLTAPMPPPQPIVPAPLTAANTLMVDMPEATTAPEPTGPAAPATIALPPAHSRPAPTTLFAEAASPTNTPAAPATQTSVQALVQMMTASVTAAPARTQQDAAAPKPFLQAAEMQGASTSPPPIAQSDATPARPQAVTAVGAAAATAAVVQADTPSAIAQPAVAAALAAPETIGSPAQTAPVVATVAKAAPEAVINAKPLPRAVRMIAPKLDRAAPTPNVGEAEAPVARSETVTARRVARAPEQAAHDTREPSTDRDAAQPQLQQQATLVAPRGTPPPVNPADVGSTDAVVARHLAIAQDNRWLDSLARDIAATGGADSRLSFTLSPENLGSLKVDITQGADGASVHMTTDTDKARAIILDAQPRLAAEARAQGLTLKETSVSTESDPRRQAQSQASAQQQAFPQPGGQQGGQDHRAFAQSQPQPLSPSLPTAADEASDGELYA